MIVTRTDKNGINILFVYIPVGKSIIWHLGDNGEVEVLSTVQDLVPKRLHQAVHRGLVLAYFKR